MHAAKCRHYVYPYFFFTCFLLYSLASAKIILKWVCIFQFSFKILEIFGENLPLCKYVAVQENAVQLACMVPLHELEQSSLVSLHGHEEWASSTALAVILRGRNYDEVGLVCSWGGLCIPHGSFQQKWHEFFGCILGKCSYYCTGTCITIADYSYLKC